MENKGHLEVICGCMFSGKSEELIRRVRRAQIARRQVQVFKPAIDNRHGIDQVVSHNGSITHAVAVDKPLNILENIEPGTEIVAIDEVQFFDDSIVDLCRILVDDMKIRVILTGLDLNFRGEPFGPMPVLLAEAEEVQKLTAICMVCGDEATRSQRLINGKPASYDDPIILIGAQEAYEPRCRAHHSVPGRPNSMKD